MSVRGIIVEEIYNRIAAAVPMAKVLVARDAEDEPADDGQLVTVIPQTEKPWEAADMNDLRSARQMALIVAVGYQPAVGADALTAWKKLEDLSETITDALLERVTEGREDSAAAYLKVFELDEVIASEQPVGGASIGLDLSFDVKYCR